MTTKTTTIDSWRRLNPQIKKCRKCPGLNIPGLTEGTVGYGSRNARVMIVGQSLCQMCMVKQIPFYGGSGLLLDEIFRRLGRKKEEFFLTNVVHCHPPRNRPSRPHEKENCRSFLEREALLLRPRVIVPVGRDAVEWFIGKFGSMQSVLYHKFRWKRIEVRPAFHPAYFWRKGEEHVETKKFLNGMVKLIEPYLQNE
jgi:uracil-DNA glycosylase family 4